MTNYHWLTSWAIDGRQSRKWYRDARRSIRAFATEHDHDPRTVSDVLALFSPRSNVTRSVNDSRHYLLTGQYRPHVMSTIRAAVNHWERTGEIRGPKTSEFAKALRGNSQAIVVDVWMCRALGVDHNLIGQRPTLFRRCQRSIANCAEILGWQPAETQAAIWASTLQRFGRNPVSLSI